MRFRYIPDTLISQLDREQLRLFLWAPVLFGMGIGAYFLLKSEPAIWPTIAALAASLCMAVLIWRWSRRAYLAWPLFLLATGFAAAQLESHLSATAMLDRDIGFAAVTGRLVDIDPLPDGRRLFIAPDNIEHLEQNQLPTMIRLTDKKAATLLVPGQSIALKGYVRAVAEPVLPDSFDFRRYAYFNHIGGSGFVTGPVTVTGNSDSWQARLMLLFADLRLQLQGRINQVLQGDQAAIAGALLTGAQNSISDDTMADMRLSGVTHILSVSGLHIGLAAGLLFFLLRALLALSPKLAQRWPIKKWAAGLSWFGALAYTLFVGAPAPAVRSLLMIGFGLLAVIVDRTPLSLRVVALSALLIMAVSPHVLLGPSFQLSYAAIIGIIGLYEMSEPWRERLKGREHGPLMKWLRVLGAVTVTSLAASIATTPLLHYHFQQLSFYGVLANLLAIPLTSFWLMPAALVALALMLIPPLAPLADATLRLLGVGVDVLMKLAHLVSTLPGAGWQPPALPVSAMLLMMFGGLWLMIWETHWRWSGFAPIALGIVLAFLPQQPKLIVSGDGRFAAIRQETGDYVLAADTDRRHADGFVPEAWESWLGQHPFLSANCDAVSCRADDIVLVRDPNALATLCRQAETLLVVPRISVGHCAARIIDSAFLRHNGSLTMDDEGKIRTVRDATGVRPWSRFDVEPESTD